MGDADSLGVRLRRLRLERGLTQLDVAAPGYTAAYVSTIESGKRTPSERAIEHFAAKLGVSPDELATGIPPSMEAEAAMRLEEGWRAVYLGRPAEAKKLFSSVDRDGRRFRRPLLRARAAVGLGRCAERGGQTADARALYERALDLFRANAPLPACAEAVAGIARCRQMAGDTRVALHVLERYLVELEEQGLPDPGALMRIHASLVWPYTELGLQEEANKAAQKALSLQTRVDAPDLIASMHLNVARALLNMGDPDAALESLRKVEEICRDLNWRTEIARAQINQGIVLMSQKEFAGARDALAEALATFQEIGFVRDEARTLNELARLERLLGNADVAAEQARKAVELLNETEQVPELALAYRELALAVRESGPDTAAQHFRKAIELYRESGELLHAADTHRLLGELLEKEEPSNEAWAEYKEGLLLVAEGLERKD